MPKVGDGIIMPGERGNEFCLIDKTTPWGRVRRGTQTRSKWEAIRIRDEEVEKLRRQAEGLSVAEHTFEEAAAEHLLLKRHLRTVDDVVNNLDLLMPYIGKVPVRSVHQRTLEPFIAARRAQGVKTATINHSLVQARAVLFTAARVLRDGDRPWLDTVPLIRLLPVSDAAKPYPLSWDEQARLLAELPGHLAKMALYALHTGCRESEIAGLRWEWEHRFEGGSVFVIPGSHTKNKQDALVVLNSVAQSVVDGERGRHPTHVFSFRGQPLQRMHSYYWRLAWRRAGLPAGPEYRRGPHNLRHTVGRRLAAAGVAQETRKAILHHSTSGDVHARYAPVDLREIRAALELLVTARPERSLLRVVESGG